ncbi:MAG: hypothetical protein JO290_09265 [Sphingomonadaceae bacterium]|nr:hypothetical protein [Sphingomonadaceae bacterium]
MLQLLERQVGCDATAIGFPSVDTCLAVVLQTTSELVGWHSLNTDIGTTAVNAGKLAVYVAASAPGLPIRLYTATNRTNHQRDWRDELRQIAAALNFHGPATAIDLKVNTEGVYVQFERNAARRCCDISYKRNSKIDYDTGKTRLYVETTRHKRLLTGAGNFGDLYGGGDGKTTVYTTVTTNDQSSKGRLNSVSWSQTNTITIP